MRIRAHARSAVLVLALCAGCFSPSLGDEPFLCGATDPTCPSGYHCTGGVCQRGSGMTRPDSGPVGDSAPGDASLADAAPGDARPGDAAIADARPAPDGFTCTAAGMFLGCRDTDTAFVCDGNLGAIERECPAGCDAQTRLCKQCIPSKVYCSGDNLVTCTVDGEAGSSKVCPVGCNPLSPACYVLQATNVPGACEGDGTGAASLTVVNETRIDTGSNGCSQVVSQGSGNPDICVLRMRDFTVGPNGRLVLRGSRAIMLVAFNTMSIAGTIDASGSVNEGGPGARSTQILGRGQSSGPNTSFGGGGGGHGTAGAAGGATVDDDTTLPGGLGYGNAQLSPLLPGAYGGAGGYSCALPPCPARDFGGGGGGALQLVACNRLEIAAGALLHANGGGGAGGNAAVVGTVLGGGGDGGGAGGAILLEAPVVDLPASFTMVANGGGGGGGGSFSAAGTGAPGNAGSSGHLNATPALGGGGGDAEAGDGGSGATIGNEPGHGIVGDPTGGGGGGAVGRLRINARPDRPVTLPPAATFSPGASTGAVLRK